MQAQATIFINLRNIPASYCEMLPYTFNWRCRNNLSSAQRVNRAQYTKYNYINLGSY